MDELDHQAQLTEDFLRGDLRSWCGGSLQASHDPEVWNNELPSTNRHEDDGQSNSEIRSNASPDFSTRDTQDNSTPTLNAMESVTHRLRAWSGERELQHPSSDDRPRWLPLESLARKSRHQSSDRSPSTEHPQCPPNTARQSGQSSAKPSEPQTPIEEDEEDDSSLDLNVECPVVLQRCSSMPAVPTCPSPRRLSNLAAEDLRFASHRDSMEFTQGYFRRQEQEGKLNQALMNTHKDSFLLTKHKLEAKRPRSDELVPSSWNRLCELREGMDVAALEALDDPTMCNGESARVEIDTEDEVKEETRPDEHKDCPICNEHRPRWFEAKHRKW